MENIRKIQNILLLKYKYIQMIKYKIFYYRKLKEIGPYSSKVSLA